MTPRESGHERAYRRLLRLYPSPFRTRYGDEMVLLFSDQLRDAREEGTPAGTAVTWLRILGDLAVTAAAERTQDGRNLAHSLAAPPSTVSRLSGLVGILGGAVILVAFLPFAPWGADLFNLRLVVFNLGAMAIVTAVHRRQVSVAPTWAVLAALPVLVANAWHLIMTVIVVSRPGPPGVGDYGPVYIAAATAMWLTDAWFGLVTLRLGVVSRLGALAIGVGSLLAYLGMANVLEFLGPTLSAVVGTLALAGIALNGLGWILLGIDVATRRRGVPASQADMARKG